MWASQFTDQRDVAYNLAYLRAVAMGLTRPEVLKAAEGARDNTPKWQANLLAVGATEKGLVLANKSVLSWRMFPFLLLPALMGLYFRQMRRNSRILGAESSRLILLAVVVKMT